MYMASIPPKIAAANLDRSSDDVHCVARWPSRTCLPVIIGMDYTQGYPEYFKLSESIMPYVTKLLGNRKKRIYSLAQTHW